MAEKSHKPLTKHYAKLLKCKGWVKTEKEEKEKARKKSLKTKEIVWVYYSSFFWSSEVQKINELISKSKTNQD